MCCEQVGRNDLEILNAPSIPQAWGKPDSEPPQAWGAGGQCSNSVALIGFILLSYLAKLKFVVNHCSRCDRFDLMNELINRITGLVN